MGGEATEGSEISKNGVSGSNAGAVDDLADIRAAFLAGDGEAKQAPTEDAVAEKVVEDPADDDKDLDEDDTADAVDDEKESESDDDKDLDEEEDKDAKVEPETAKRLEQVRRTDKRLREQREAQFRERETKIDRHVAELEAKWGPRVQAAEEFEKLKSRRHDPISILKALGYEESDFPDIARETWAHSPEGLKDPKNKEAIARGRKERELSDELAALRKKFDERESTEKQRSEEARIAREVDVYLGKVGKAASDKTPLAKAYLAEDADGAHEDIRLIAGRLTGETGQVPDPKRVMIELEKQERRRLRRYGVDPKAIATKPLTATTAATDAKVKAIDKTAGKTAGKTADKKTATKKTDTTEAKPLTKEDFIRGTYD